MVHDEAGIERRELVRLRKADPAKILIDGAVDRAVEEAAEQHADPELAGVRGMRITGPGATLRIADHHRHAPGIRAEQPVDRRLLEFAKARVTSHAAIHASPGSRMT